VLQAPVEKRLTDHNSGAPPAEAIDLCGCLMGAGPVLQAPVWRRLSDHGATVVRRHEQLTFAV
jgi:hypothetical protein